MNSYQMILFISAIAGIFTSVLAYLKDRKSGFIALLITLLIICMIMLVNGNPFSSSDVIATPTSAETSILLTQPPITQPPVTQPPVTQPPATQPPVTQPPVTQPPKKDLTYISFTGHNFSRNKKFKVYSAPSTTSWYSKTKSGDPVYASTNDVIYVAGYAGNWLLIRYETNGGSYRMGYTSQASGNFNNLSFNYYPGTITSNCSITDGTASIGISNGTSITVLGRMDAGIYIEAYVNGQQTRGTVPESCVSW